MFALSSDWWIGLILAGVAAGVVAIVGVMIAMANSRPGKNGGA